MGRRRDIEKNKKTLIEEALENVRLDRILTSKLIEDILPMVSKNPDSFRELGTIAAKLVETLQRSNEQLVKIADLASKRNAQEENLSSEDTDQLFDQLQEEINHNGI